MFKTILVPTDGSELADKAAQAAAEFAQDTHGRIIALAVAEPYPYSPLAEPAFLPDPAAYDKGVLELAETYVSKVKAAAEQAGVPCETYTMLSADPAKEKLYYDAAFDLIKAKDFDKASQAFTAFLRKYPNSQYAGNAQYWLGEVNLAKGDLQAAGQAFAKVSQLYPKHAKVPDSLYKLADVERRLGHTDKVKGILQQVIAQYPGTSAAQLAQRDLQRM